MRHFCEHMTTALRAMRVSSRVLRSTSLHEALGVQAFTVPPRALRFTRTARRTGGPRPCAPSATHLPSLPLLTLGLCALRRAVGGFLLRQPRAPAPPAALRGRPVLLRVDRALLTAGTTRQRALHPPRPAPPPSPFASAPSLVCTSHPASAPPPHPSTPPSRPPPPPPPQLRPHHTPSQADLVLLVALAESSPAPAPIETLLRDARAPAARELVLLHTQPCAQNWGSTLRLSRAAAARLGCSPLRVRCVCVDTGRTSPKARARGSSRGRASARITTCACTCPTQRPAAAGSPPASTRASTRATCIGWRAASSASPLASYAAYLPSSPVHPPGAVP